ncbi:MAG: acyltransferase [Muribaculum sp.]|nr:acyltransferase [Muribaculum sp.]
MNSKKLFLFNLLIKFLPPSRCLKFKAKMLRWCGAKVGKYVEIFTPSIQGNFNLEIGDNVFIGHEALIFGAAGSTIKIEDYAKIGSRVVVVTGTHTFSLDGPCIEGPGIFKNVLIKTGAVISTGSTVLPGKTIGCKAHVAAGSIVTHDVPDMTRVAGVPAKIIKDFTE